jgi:hypothetical protein
VTFPRNFPVVCGGCGDFHGFRGLTGFRAESEDAGSAELEGAELRTALGDAARETGSEDAVPAAGEQ